MLRDRPVIDGVVIPRNTYRNKGFSQVDLRVQRGFKLPGNTRAILSLELFNLFDCANVEIGSANMVYGPGTVVQNGALVTPGAAGELWTGQGRQRQLPAEQHACGRRLSRRRSD